MRPGSRAALAWAACAIAGATAGPLAAQDARPLFATLRYFDEFNEEMRAGGWATWSLEDRPVDVEGGGWPGTFTDVATGVDLLREIAAEHPLDLDRVAVVGHSAGGHLALWAAGRARIPEGSELYRPNPVVPSAAISLGGLGDLEAFHASDVPTCGPDIMPRLLGAAPEDAVELHILDGAGHFEPVAPWSPGWEVVRDLILRFLEENVP